MGNAVGFERNPPATPELLLAASFHRKSVVSTSSASPPPPLPSGGLPSLPSPICEAALYAWRFQPGSDEFFHIACEAVLPAQLAHLSDAHCYLLLHMYPYSLLKSAKAAADDEPSPRSPKSPKPSAAPATGGGGSSSLPAVSRSGVPALRLGATQAPQPQQGGGGGGGGGGMSESSHVLLSALVAATDRHLTPRGLSIVSAGISCEALAHTPSAVASANMVYDIYVWNGKASKPMTRAVTLATACELDKGLAALCAGDSSLAQIIDFAALTPLADVLANDLAHVSHDEASDLALVRNHLASRVYVLSVKSALSSRTLCTEALAALHRQTALSCPSFVPRLPKRLRKSKRSLGTCGASRRCTRNLDISALTWWSSFL